MNKVMLEIYLPAAQKSYDILVPADMQLGQAVKLTAQALTQLSDELYTMDENALLCDRESGKILNINMTIWGLGLRNGSSLMLI